MESLLMIPRYAIPFLLVLSVLVFVHEMGHYLVARLCGVRVEAFSIGFGKKLFGFTDKHGTNWKICMIPLGGYVQMFGDADPTSSKVSVDEIQVMSPEQRKEAFFFKPVWQRALIVFAGPAINFLYALVVMSILFAVQGQIYAPAEVGGLVEDGPAAKAGFELGDKVLSINGVPLESFQELQRQVGINLGTEMVFQVQRKDQQLTLKTMPGVLEQEDNFGFKHRVGRIGVMSVGNTAIKKHTPGSAVIAAAEDMWSMTLATLRAMGQMITGVRSTDELGGVIRIGAYAKEFSDAGALSLLMFSALISINLGLINLFPIPLLDGGHLLFYFYEAIAGRPMPEKLRMAGLKLGYILVVTLMIYATFNDLLQLKVFDFIAAKLGS
ncbi:MAG: zinc metalloprotease [Alphaproteobacteria bacterium]|nr:zinc metalloprotease [Alphaproteobacteria bacterium]